METTVVVALIGLAGTFIAAGAAVIAAMVNARNARLEKTVQELIERAEKLIEEKRLSEAVVQYEDVLKIKPSQPDATAGIERVRDEQAEDSSKCETDAFGSKSGSSNARVNAVLCEIPKTFKQIVDATGLTPKQVRYKHLDELVKKGILVREKSGGASAWARASLDQSPVGSTELELVGNGRATQISTTDVDSFGFKLGTSDAKVNAVLNATPKTFKQIVDETGLTKKQVRYSHLDELVKKGILVRTELDGASAWAIGQLDHKSFAQEQYGSRTG